MNLVDLWTVMHVYFPRVFFTFTLCDQLNLYCKTLKGLPQLEGQAHPMIACSSLHFSVFLFDTHHQVMVYNRASTMREVV